jgi:carbon monoxide dehydrogenase subunit G
VEFTDEFRVSLPVEPAWDLLNDVERIAPCMPGARLTGAEGDTYQGTVKVRVGPVVVEYKGTATVESRDRTDHAMKLRAAGRDSKGQGNAQALVTALLAPDGEGTRITVTTQLTITGKVAQFGRGVIEDVSKKLLAQFTTNLEDMLAAAPPEPVTAQPASEPVAAPAAPETAAPAAESPAAEAPTAEAPMTAPAAERSPQPPSQPSAQPSSEPSQEPIDLLGVARGAVLKRLIPTAVGALVIAGIVVWLTRR